MEEMTSNITDVDQGQKLNFFITSLFSQYFFYNYEFLEKNPTNLQLENVKVKWWYPDILFGYHEYVTRFELFKRRMKIGYLKFGESFVSALTILPSNFNDLETNVNVDAIYGDKIVVLTRKMAKMYYIISEAVKADINVFIDKSSVATFIFVYKKSIIGEIYKVENGEFCLIERIEKRFLVSKKENEAALCSVINLIKSQLVQEYKHSDVNIVFFDYNVNDVNQENLRDYFVIKRNNLDEDELIHAGALFKAKEDISGNVISFVDTTRKMPYFDIVYSLLNEAPNYHPLTEAFGIDLGTSRSALAVHRFHENADILDVIPDQHDAESLLFSWVAFDQRDQKNICGKTVFQRFKSRGEYIVYDCKKIIGKAYDEIVKDPHWRFKLSDNKRGGVEIKVKSRNENGKDVDKIVTPEEVYAIMLQRFQSNATNFVSKSIEKAVFTIPSKFTQKQKNAMKEAAKLANIEVLRFIPEPTAAALSYCSEMKRKLNDNEKLFVFDLGGGTFDISIFKVVNTKLIELCQCSNVELGGSNFDKILFNYSKNAFLKEHELDLTDKENDLVIKSSLAKEALTESEFTNINFQKNKNDNADEDDVDLHITREQFQDLSESLLEKLKEDVDKALQKAHLYSNDITLVIKVGGSCAMPMIKSLIAEKFPNSEVNFSDPQHEVAKGAALYAASILPQKKVQTDFIKNHWPL